jgi:putative N6-adenine-specific DNA methylase
MGQRRPEGKYRQKREKIAPGRTAMVAQTLQGLEGVLANELKSIGGNNIEVGKRAVYFSADKDLIYKANLRLRTALRILMPLKRFSARNEDELYDGARSIDWTALFSVEKNFVIKSTVTGHVHTHSYYATLKVKDAIVDQFRDELGKRPSIDSQNPEIVIHLKIYNDDVIISLDSSGEPLNKRGYRQKDAAAPLNECLAAGMLLIAGYTGRTDFVDGMCGSGTLCIEAAMIAHKIAPGLLRDDFAFMHWNDYDADLFEVIHTATVERVRDTSIKIIGIDNDFETINQAREAAQLAKVDDMIEFRMGDFFTEVPPAPPAMLVMNPPYDERIKSADIEDLYEDIGSKLKKDYAGYAAWILSGHPDAMNYIGLRTFDTHHLFNGKIPCRYSGYRMYSGTKEQST